MDRDCFKVSSRQRETGVFPYSPAIRRDKGNLEIVVAGIGDTRRTADSVGCLGGDDGNSIRVSGVSRVVRAPEKIAR